MNEINMEDFVVKLLNDIKKAGLKNENYDLHLEAVSTKKLAKAIDTIHFIEVY